MSERQSDSREFKQDLDAHIEREPEPSDDCLCIWEEIKTDSSGAAERVIVSYHDRCPIHTAPSKPSTEISRWADPAMFEAEPMDRDESGRVTPKVSILWATPDPLGAVAAMCRMYEGKPTRDLADITDDERTRYWEQVGKTHLKAPLEAVKFHFFIEGVTRAFTHQMVRQRTAVYAQESLRFAVKENVAEEAAIPPSLLPSPLNDKAHLRKTWGEALDHVDAAYHQLIANGVPAEDARGLLPHATTTRLNYVTDLRALFDHAGNRLCTQAQFEWRSVFLGIVAAIASHNPPLPRPNSKDIGYEPRTIPMDVNDWQFKLIARSEGFRPVCFQIGHCPFTAEFDRQCTIRERVQEGKFEEIRPEEYMADPTAGRRG